MNFNRALLVRSVSISSILVVSLALSAVVIAKNSNAEADNSSQGQGVGNNLQVNNSSFLASSHKDSSESGKNSTDSGKLSGKMRACQAHEGSIKQRSNHLTQLSTDMENKFDAITQRVENFYTSKVVPGGKTVSNYNALVADIQTQKGAIQTALTAAQTDASNFSCNSSDPKAQLIQYRTDMQSVIKALKSYRTSVKNLIVAVHSVTGQINSEKGTASGSAKVKNASESAEKGG